MVYSYRATYCGFTQFLSAVLATSGASESDTLSVVEELIYCHRFNVGPGRKAVLADQVDRITYGQCKVLP